MGELYYYPHKAKVLKIPETCQKSNLLGISIPETPSRKEEILLHLPYSCGDKHHPHWSVSEKMEPLPPLSHSHSDSPSHSTSPFPGIFTRFLFKEKEEI